MRHKLFLVLSFYVRFFTAWLPDTAFTMRLRGWLYGRMMKQVGRNFQVAEQVRLRGLENLAVGDDVYIGPNTTVLLRTCCEIGDNVLIGPNCVIVDSNHGFDGISYRFARGRSGKITIGEGAWLAANVVVTQSATVEPGIVIAPNNTVQREPS